MKELFPLQTFHQDAVLKRLSELYENEKDLDSKVPTPEVSDSGKVLMVGEDGSYELGIPSGGTKLYKHSITWPNNRIVIIDNYPNEYDSQHLTDGLEEVFVNAVSVKFYDSASDSMLQCLSTDDVLSLYGFDPQGQEGASVTIPQDFTDTLLNYN